jgi:hypothetical protein
MRICVLRVLFFWNLARPPPAQASRITFHAHHWIFWGLSPITTFTSPTRPGLVKARNLLVAPCNLLEVVRRLLSLQSSSQAQFLFAFDY